MITRRRLERLEGALDPARQSPDKELRRAMAAGEAGTWTWHHARLVFGEPAAEFARALPDGARAARSDGSWPDMPTAEEGPYKWALQILSYRPEETVPPGLPEQLPRAAQDPRRLVHERGRK